MKLHSASVFILFLASVGPSVANVTVTSGSLKGTVFESAQFYKKGKKTRYYNLINILISVKVTISALDFHRFLARWSTLRIR
jgi:hypothetical protein